MLRYTKVFCACFLSLVVILLSESVSSGHYYFDCLGFYVKEKTCGTLDESLCIANAESVYDTFLKALDASNAIEVEASRVKKVDTAGLQIILAVKNRLDKAGGNIMWNKPSKELVDSAKVLGVSGIVGLDD